MDERNRTILAYRWERHQQGLCMGRLMAMDGKNRKPYTMRPLKTKPWPSDIYMVEKALYPACEWPPKQRRGEPRERDLIDHPVVDINYRCYLEVRGRLIRHDELPRDSQPLSKPSVFELDVDGMIEKERRLYKPAECRLTVYD